MTNRIVRWMLGVAAAWTLTSAAAAHAQSVAAPVPAGPNTLVGVVTDDAGNYLGNVDVFIRELQRRTRTRDDGSFRFDSVKTGKYDVVARYLGFLSRTYRVTVNDRGGTVAISMVRVAFALPSMISTAERGGLSGVIGDTAYRAMPDVTVRVMGSEPHAVTDSAGAFFLDLKPGRYLLTLERDGFVRQTVGVTVPKDEGRKIAAWMVPRTERSNPRETQNLFEMSQRVMRASPVWARFYTREDMERMGMTEVRQAANISAMRILDADCPVIIDGGPRTIPLWQLLAADIEFVEVYTTRPSNRGVTSINGAGSGTGTLGTSTSMIPTSSCGVTVMAWMRH